MTKLTANEQVMAAIWTTVLGQVVRAPDADFFALGGSSLLAMQIAAEASAKFGKAVSVVDVLMNSSLGSLVSAIEDSPPAVGSVLT
jgi:hypothetical protein